jgi:lysophospholipase L1-like esterase
MNVTPAVVVRAATRGAVWASGTVVVGGVVLLVVEAAAAAARRYAQQTIRPGMRARLGPPGAPRLTLVMLGDSTAAGVGVSRVEESVGGRLAERLAGGGRQVDLSSVAVSGARSDDLDLQVSRALLAGRPDLAVVLVGGQDAVHGVRPRRAAAALAGAVRRLRAAGVSVVVGGCPDLGASRAIGQPLRELVGWLGRRLARAQLDAARDEGAAAVDLAARTGAVFRADAGMLCEDGFHPSADGYRLWAHALYPVVAEQAHATDR